jgi:hypothetical protein
MNCFIGLLLTNVLFAAGEWGQEAQGVKTRLTALEKAHAAGKPMRFRLEMLNVSKKVVQYDAQQVDVNDSMLVIGPDGKVVPYIASGCQTTGGGQPLKPGESVVLFKELDVADQYLMSKPGRYKVQYRKGDKAFGEVDFPASNVIEIDITKGKPKPSDAILEKMIPIVPGKDWEAKKSYSGEVAPEGRETTTGHHLYFIRLRALKADLRFVNVWITDKPVAEKAKERKTKSTFAGTSQWGNVYIGASPQMEQIWKDYLSQIKAALQIKPAS